MAGDVAHAKTDPADWVEMRLWCDKEAPLDEVSSKLTSAKSTLKILQMQFKPALDGPALQKEEVCKLLNIAFELVRSAARTTDQVILLDAPVQDENDKEKEHAQLPLFVEKPAA